MMDIRWKQKRHEKGYVYHEMYDMWDQVAGLVVPDGKQYLGNVRGRSAFKRKTVKSAKADVEYIYEKLGVA
jgi:hypothetical protein